MSTPLYDTPIYTTCVKPEDYSPVSKELKDILKSFPHELGFALLSFVMYGIPGLFGSAIAAMAALHKVCDFLLHGKLVCLGGDECAIGHVVSFETVDQKSGFETIDNDFSINLMLAPHDLEFFATDPPKVEGGLHTYPSIDVAALFDKKYEDVKTSKQGRLITEQVGVPEPVEYIDKTSRYHPTYTEFPDRSMPAYFSNQKMATMETGVQGKTGQPSSTAFRVPVLHCEIEGERIDSVCYALDLPTRLLGLNKLCRWKPLGIPIGRFACSVASLALLPLVLAALAIAWVAGSGENRDFEHAGRLAPGDEVVIKGRWVYDSGHQGWNELHPVTQIQRTSEYGASKDIDELVKRWCGALERNPPKPGPYRGHRGHRENPGRSAGTVVMTPLQQQTYDQQLRPENRWILHPSVDGCSDTVDAGVR